MRDTVITIALLSAEKPKRAQLTKTPAELPAAAVEQNNTPAVEPNKMFPASASSVESVKAPAIGLNEAQPAAIAIETSKMSAAPDTTVEPEVQPAAAAREPNKISPAPSPTVEPDEAPAELPAVAVEHNETPPRTSAGAVLRGSDIPD